MKPKIIRVFQNVDMRNQHIGLTSMIAGGAPDVGEIVIFLNRKRNIVKVFGGNNVIGHYRGTHAVSMDVIQWIPEAFGSSGFSMPEAIKRSLESVIGRRGRFTSKERNEHRASV